jgi:hypothetical protein
LIRLATPDCLNELHRRHRDRAEAIIVTLKIGAPVAGRGNKRTGKARAVLLLSDISRKTNDGR